MTIIRTILGSLDDPKPNARPVSRRDALRGSAAWTAGVAVAAAPVVLAGLARNAFGQSASLPPQIVDALNFALTLEYLEEEFYRQGLFTPGLIPETDGEVFGQIYKHEQAHVVLLQQALGSAAVARPTFDFTAGGQLGDVFTNYNTFKAVSQGLEDTGVRAYKGQVGNLIENDAILETALRIHSVEARHASVVRRLRLQKGWITGAETDVPLLAPVYAGEEALNGAASGNAGTEAFDEPLNREQVEAIAQLFIAG